MCIAIGRAASQIELFELRKIGGERAPTVPWNSIDHAAQRDIEPRDRAVGEHDRSIVRLNERAAPGRDDHTALGKQLVQDLPSRWCESTLRRRA